MNSVENASMSPSRIGETLAVPSSKGLTVRKILIAGSGAVGKTSLVRVMKHNLPLSAIEDDTTKYHRTPFVELETVKVENSGEEGVFQMVDVSGQLDSVIHPLRDMSKIAMGKASVVLLMFSGDNVQSLLDLSQWIETITDYYSERDSEQMPDFVLVKNKADLHDDIDQSLVDAVMKCNPWICKYHEVSCLTGKGVKEVMEWLVKRCMMR
ncbi:MAG: GTPase domain-containing protein [Candidatus Thorarchaeota archaeon]|nr:MAG: GTPase domain-containing protein [Candidatus Thorarchaeota archaeon]